MNEFDQYRTQLSQAQVREAWLQTVSASIAGMLAGGKESSMNFHSDTIERAVKDADFVTKSMIARFGPKEAT